MALLRVRFKSFARLAPVGCLLALCLAVGCRPAKQADGAPLMVFVASSLADVVGGLAAGFEAQSGASVEISAAATGVLRRQIEAGAACDVFIAADAFELDKLTEAHKVLTDSRVDLAGNSLVVVGRRAEGAVPWENLQIMADAKSGRIAIGNPAYVPAGRYAKRALEAAGLWKSLGSRLVLADNVRVACQYVRTGQAGLGIVYGSDAARMADLEVVWRFDVAMTGRVTCPAVVCVGSQDPDQAKALLRFLGSEQQVKIWERYGFVRATP